MLALYIIGSIVGYSAIGGIISGYISGKDNISSSSEQLQAVLFWPVYIAFWPAAIMFDLTKKLAKEHTKKKEKKCIAEEKKRIEFQNIDEEIDVWLDDQKQLKK